MIADPKDSFVPDVEDSFIPDDIGMQTESKTTFKSQLNKPLIQKGFKDLKEQTTFGTKKDIGFSVSDKKAKEFLLTSQKERSQDELSDEASDFITKKSSEWIDAALPVMSFKRTAGDVSELKVKTLTKDQEKSNRAILEDFRGKIIPLLPDARKKIRENIELSELPKDYKNRLIDVLNTTEDRTSVNAQKRGLLGSALEEPRDVAGKDILAAAASEIDKLTGLNKLREAFIPPVNSDIDRMEWQDRLAARMSNIFNYQLDNITSQEIANSMAGVEEGTAEALGGAATQSLFLATDMALASLATGTGGAMKVVDLLKDAKKINRGVDILTKLMVRGVQGEAANVMFRGGQSKDISFVQGVAEGGGEALFGVVGGKVVDKIVKSGIPKKYAKAAWEFTGGTMGEAAGELAGDLSVGNIGFDQIDSGVLGQYLILAAGLAGGAKAADLALGNSIDAGVDKAVSDGVIPEFLADDVKVATKQAVQDVPGSLQEGLDKKGEFLEADETGKTLDEEGAIKLAQEFDVAQVENEKLFEQTKTLTGEEQRKALEELGVKNLKNQTRYEALQIATGQRKPGESVTGEGFDFTQPLEGQVRKYYESQKTEQPTIEKEPIKENLDTQEVGSINERSFIKTVEGSDKTTEQLGRKVKELDEYYAVITNDESIRSADKIIKNDIQEATDRVLSGDLNAENSAVAIRLIKHFESTNDFESASKIIDEYDKRLREAGRFIQAASLWNKLKPVTLVKKADQVSIKNTGKELDRDVKANILKRMSEIQKLKEGDEKSQLTAELLSYIADNIPLTFKDYFNAFRYTNMLSNPLSHLRNVYSNAFNVFLVEPMVLGTKAGYNIFRDGNNSAAIKAKMSDAPRYYMDVFTNIPSAIRAAFQTFTTDQFDQKFFDVEGYETSIEAARRNKLGYPLTFINRLLESEDRFFATLISQGEKLRLIRGGVSEFDANTQASALAEKYLYREKIDPDDKDRLSVVRAIDSLGKTLDNARRAKYIGKPISWFIPFLRTPINIAKRGVEFSPFAVAEITVGRLVGKKYSADQYAQAFLGTIVVGLGALLANEDRTEWLPPKDDKEREIFYASGRKPFSIMIGDLWVPMVYFGPFAFSLALPAAVKYYQQESKSSLTDSQSEKIADAILGVGNFVVSQTPFTGLQDLNETISGRQDIGKTLGRSASQVIPLSGLIRYTNNWIDPVYRKTKTFDDIIKSGIPGLSKELKAYEVVPAQEGGISTEAIKPKINQVIPFAVGFGKNEYTELLKARRKKIQENEKRRIEKMFNK